MANVYWVGDSGSWSDGNHWAMASGDTPNIGYVPMNGDLCFFDDLSFSGGGKTVTLDTDTYIGKLNWTDTLGNTFAFGAYSIYATIEVIFSSSATIISSSGATIYLDCTSATIGNPVAKIQAGSATQSFPVSVYLSDTMYSAGLKYAEIIGNFGTHNVELSYVSESVNFDISNSDFTCNYFTFGSGVSSANTSILSGSSCTIKCKKFIVTEYSDTSSNYYGIIRLIENSNGECLSLPSANNTGYLSGGVTYVDGNAKVHGNGFNLGEFHITSAVGSGQVSIYDSNTIYKFLVDTNPKTIKFEAGKTTTVNGASNFSVVGTAGNLITLHSLTDSSYFTIDSPSSSPAGDLTMDYIDLKDCHVTGTAVYNAGSHSTDNGGNNGWTWGTHLFQKIFSEGMTMQSTFAKKIHLLITYIECMTTNESFSKLRQIFCSFIDGIKQNDAIKGFHNGWDVVWLRIKKTVSSWTNTGRNSDDED